MEQPEPLTEAASELAGLLALTGRGPDLFSQHHLDGAYRYASPNHASVLGLLPEELAGRHPSEFTHPDDVVAVQAAFDAVVAEAGTGRVRYRFRDHGQRWRWFESSLVVLGERDGQDSGVHLVSRDVTAEQEALQHQARQDRFLRVLIGLAVGFVNHPFARFDASIDEVLAVTGGFTGADRAYLFRFHDDRLMTNTHEWCRPGVPAVRDQLRGVPIAAAGDLRTRLATEGLVQVEDVRGLDPHDPFRRTLEAQGIRTVIVLPLQDDEEVLGLVGLDAVGAPRTFDDTDRDLLRVVAGLCTNAVLRREREEHLRRNRALLEELTGQLTATMETVSDGIALLDPDQRITYANTQLATILGVSIDALLDHRVGDDPAATAAGILETAVSRAVASGDPWTSVEQLRSPQRWLEVRAYPTDRGVAAYVRDVSEQVAHERALQEAAAVEREVAAQLRALDRTKNAFLSAVSHELRTPLTVIRGMAETLQRTRDRLDQGQRARLEDALVDHSTELARLLDELLQVDRLARGQLVANREPFDLVPLAHSVIDTHADPARVLLEGPPTLPVHLDRVQVESLLANLLINAGKYAPASPVSVRLAPRAGGGATISVADQGPGIPAEHLHRVFEPFVRLAESHPRPGTGVGLTLVAEFARLHGGRAYALDTSGGGAEVVAELPGP